MILIAYLIGAFINYDLWFLSDVSDWNSFDRLNLVVLLICIIYIDAALISMKFKLWLWREVENDKHTS